ncbi:beta strand repeat-containing protein, partial [uncultured Bradyrhizobium sp.]|uniref:beta strand repeat-containing protein n=1 Tax=uncultured Bradyrhizobium sp. TaxID=199684 RepID=UPI0035CBA0AA
MNFSLAGANGGIINKANAGQIITINNNIGEIFAGVRVHQDGNSTLILSGANTYSGNTTISAGALQVTNNGSVGTGNVILDGGIFQADGLSNLKFDNRFRINAAGGAIDAHGATLTLSGKISNGTGAGPLEVLDTIGGGRVVFIGTNTYTGGTTICNCGTLQLGTAANSGSIIGTIDNKGTFNIVNADTSGITTLTNQPGAIATFRNSTDAGTMTINNRIFAGTVFNNASAGQATINTIAGSGVGFVKFTKNSTAADATINNAGFNYVMFNDKAKLEGGRIVNADAGAVLFYSNSSAGNIAASITNNDYGQVHFRDNSTAGSATITNNDAAALDFNNHASADSAVIVNNSSYGMDFRNHSTAGNAFITTNAASATYFSGHSDGASARFETASGGIVDFSESRGPNNDGRINAGSIAGAGSYYIGGGNTLVTGGNDRSTEVSGVIDDNNLCGCTTGPGALEKIGVGTLTLSGANSYTGGTTITAGTLQLGNNTTAGSILGDVVNNATLAFRRSNAYQFDGAISGSGAVQQDGAGTTILTAGNSYTGATTITAGTLALSGTGSITGSSDVIANGAFDISGAAAGVSIKTLSGAGTVALGSRTLTLTNASGTFAGAIGGSGGVTLAAGTETLSGVNGYTGATTITGGTLALSGAGSVGSSSGVLAGGAFDISGVSAADTSIQTLTGGGSVTLGAKTLTLTNASGNFAGAIGGNGGMTVAAGTQTLSGSNSYAGATAITAGTLALSGTGSIASSSSVIANGAFDISATTAGAAIKNLSGTGTVALGSRTLTLTNASGAFAGDGGLIKQGAGLFTLSGASTYLGATTVAGGNLRVNGSIASAVTVQSGAMLSGTGSVGGAVTVLSGGTLSAGQSPGTLTLGALNLNAGSTSVFELGSAGVAGGASNDLVRVTGNLTLGGTLSVNAPSAGYYRLFDYGTLAAGGFDVISGSSNGTPAVLTNVPNQVNLLIAAAGQHIQFWDGADQTGNGVVNGGTGTWSAVRTNWTGAPGQAGINDQWHGSVGVFAGTAGTVTIAAAQAFDTLQFSTTGYVLNAGAGGQLQLAGLSGIGAINTDTGIAATIDAPIVNGTAQSLTKAGGGTLILAGAGSYSGGTTISGGTLQLGDG